MNKAKVSLVSTVTAGYANYMRAHTAVKERTAVEAGNWSERVQEGLKKRNEKNTLKVVTAS